MTRVPDVINQKINKYAGAMEALAKGDEMTCIHDWDFTPGSDLAMFMCLKCGEKLDVVDAMNRLNMLEDDAARLRKEGDEYRAQLAARDALIERLMEAGNDMTADCEASWYALHIPVCTPVVNWRALVDKYSAKDGGGE